MTWYAKSKAEQDMELEEERRRMKDLDEDLLNSALGIKAKKKWTGKASLDEDDLKQLLARGSTAGVREDEEVETERVKGLGAAPTKFHDHIERKSSVQKEIEKIRGTASGDSSLSERKDPNIKVIVPIAKTSADMNSRLGPKSLESEQNYEKKAIVAKISTNELCSTKRNRDSSHESDSTSEDERDKKKAKSHKKKKHKKSKTSKHDKEKKKSYRHHEDDADEDARKKNDRFERSPSRSPARQIRDRSSSDEDSRRQHYNHHRDERRKLDDSRDRHRPESHSRNRSRSTDRFSRRDELDRRDEYRRYSDRDERR